MSEYKKSTPEVRQFTLKQLRTPGGHECKGQVCHKEHTWKEISAMVGASESVVHRDWRQMRGTLRNPASRRRETLFDLLEDAPCRADTNPAYVLEPFTSRGLKHPESTYAAWLTCTACPVKDACFEMVRPEEWFEGVASARVWSKGRDMTDEFLKRFEKYRERLG